VSYISQPIHSLNFPATGFRVPPLTHPSTSHRCRFLDTNPPPPPDAIKRELDIREKYLRQFQDRSEERWFQLHRVYLNSSQFTDRDKLDKEEADDVYIFDRFMVREIKLLSTAEILAQEWRRKLKGMHDEINEKDHGEKTCVPKGDCGYCSNRAEEIAQAIRRGTGLRPYEPPRADVDSLGLARWRG